MHIGHSQKNSILTTNPIVSKDFSLADEVRSFGSTLAHSIFDGITELASVIPQLSQEIHDLHDAVQSFFPDFLSVDEENILSLGSPLKNYEDAVAAGHQKIDDFFSTEHSGIYTPEFKAQQNAKFSTSIIPIPGIGIAGVKARIPPTLASPVRGWSVGQDITNRTIFGTVPRWSTVRQRYWKNQAQWAKSNSNHTYGNNIKRMENGLAPQRKNQFTGKIYRS